MSGRTVRLRSLLCNCLAGGAGSGAIDAGNAAALADPATDHLALAALAGRHLVTPALAEAVAATPGLAERLPEAFAAYLAFLRQANRRRNRSLRRELGQVAMQLNAFGIAPVLLKGAVRLVDDLYPHPAWRFLRDLDLLVPADRVADACAALELVGYRARHPRRPRPNDHRHVPGLVREGGSAPVELHLAPLALGSPLCDATAVSARARPATVCGARISVPHPADQLVLLVEHDRADEELRQAGRFLLRSALEFALLCRAHPAAVPEVLARFSDAGLERALRVHARRTARAFAGIAPTPSAALGTGTIAVRATTAMVLASDRMRLQRLYWFARRRLTDLAREAPVRKRLLRRLATPEFYGLCLRRLREVWTDC